MRRIKKRQAGLIWEEASRRDLHGLTLEEALCEVEREVNHRFIQEGGTRRLEFVTGRGEILRPGVKEYLTNHSLVKEVRVAGASLRVLLEDL